MVSTIDEARTPAELAEWLRVWADGYEEGVDYLDDNDARQLAAAVERVCQIGNAAALREALEGCMHEMCERCDSYMADNMQSHKPCPGCVIVDKARAALAAPARNCDVGTAEEQAERHERFCAAHYKAAAVDAQCFGCPASDKKETDCEFVWGQLPFAPVQEGKEARRG